VSFEYHEAASLDEATGLLATHGEDAMPIAGATAFAILYRQGLIRPAHVVGLRRCTELRGITASDSVLRIGALATHREIETSGAVRAQHAALADAFSRIATPRVRAWATLGGNLAHADPAQDPPPALMAFDAIVELAGPGGSRRDVPVASLFVDHFTTSLDAAELIVAVRVPRVVPGTRAHYVKFLPRSQDDYATVSVAALVRLEPDGSVAHARVALGGVGPVPIRATQVEQALLGGPLTKDAIAAAASVVTSAIDPLTDARGTAAYKRDMAVVWTRRALEELAT
jgi:aerobic carbon-monoxide dehydrogenase medium subunit